LSTPGLGDFLAASRTATASLLAGGAKVASKRAKEPLPRNLPMHRKGAPNSPLPIVIGEQSAPRQSSARECPKAFDAAIHPVRNPAFSSPAPGLSADVIFLIPWGCE